MTQKRELESLIEAIAEIRALQALMTLVLLSGPDNISREYLTPEVVGDLNRRFADSYESHMREMAGVDPRSTPRESTLEKIGEMISDFDWSKVTMQ